MGLLECAAWQGTGEKMTTNMRVCSYASGTLMDDSSAHCLSLLPGSHLEACLTFFAVSYLWAGQCIDRVGYGRILAGAPMGGYHQRLGRRNEREPL